MEEYLLHKKADIGPCMDVRGYNGRIFAIQRKGKGRLYTLSGELELISVYEGIGNARQMEIKDGIAAISAREDGLWLFDVRGEAPVLMSHYRTVEFATGITMYKNFVFVSCRQFGVEIIDISEPAHPKYAGVIRVGEAQSACVYRDVLFCGVWGAMKVVAVDISDISAPRVIAEYPLSGRGDGVTVRDGMLYASTGQHKRGIKNVVDKNDPNFGKGNGIEIFDVRDPKNPAHITWDFFSEGYSTAFDMWKPMLCGDMLICNCSILGVYGYDVNSLQKIFHISVPEKDGKADPVTGTASYGGKLYISTGLGGLYMFDGLRLDEGYFYDEDTSIRSSIPELICEGVKDCELEQLYKGDFPVLAADELCEKYLALATGERGIHVINSDSFELVAQSECDGFCYDLKVSGDCIFAAFGRLGVKTFKFSGNTLELISSIDVGGTAQQVKTTENGRFLAVTVGSAEVKMLDMRSITEPKEIYCRRASEGPLYGENFLSHSFGGRGISLFWHRDGLVYSDPEGGDIEFHAIKFPLKNGCTGFCPGNGCDIVGDNILFAHKGGYILLPKDGKGFADEGPTYRTEDKIRGKFLIDGKYLIVTERAEGTVTVTDIENIKAPTRVAGIKINASPSKAVKTSRGIFIPSRFGGLLRLSYRKG